MKKIIMADTNNEYVIDDEDYEYLKQWKWYDKNRRYAYRRKLINNKIKRILLHIEILKRKLDITNIPEGYCCDHIDSNRKNNMRNNLRLISKAQNTYNRSKNQRECTSKYIGVSKYIATDKRNNNIWIKTYWRVGLMINGKKYYKTFPYTIQGEIEAALYRDKLTKQYFGEYGKYNFDHELTIKEINQLVQEKSINK